MEQQSEDSEEDESDSVVIEEAVCAPSLLANDQLRVAGHPEKHTEIVREHTEHTVGQSLPPFNYPQNSAAVDMNQTLSEIQRFLRASQSTPASTSVSSSSLADGNRDAPASSSGNGTCANSATALLQQLWLLQQDGRGFQSQSTANAVTMANSTVTQAESSMHASSSSGRSEALNVLPTSHMQQQGPQDLQEHQAQEQANSDTTITAMQQQLLLLMAIQQQIQQPPRLQPLVSPANPPPNHSSILDIYRIFAEAILVQQQGGALIAAASPPTLLTPDDTTNTTERKVQVTSSLSAPTRLEEGNGSVGNLDRFSSDTTNTETLLSQLSQMLTSGLSPSIRSASASSTDTGNRQQNPPRVPHFSPLSPSAGHEGKASSSLATIVTGALSSAASDSNLLTATLSAAGESSALPQDSIESAPSKPISKRQKRQYHHESFPAKLHRLLHETEVQGKDDVISWNLDGTAIVIHQPEVFEEEIIPNYFRHSKLSSFKRQLSMYGFARLIQGPDAGNGFSHPLFRKGQPELSKSMDRVT